MQTPDLGCTPKYLPTDVLVDAARTAVCQNPANQPAPMAQTGIILPPEHLAVLTSKYWGAKGVKLTVAFLEPTSNELQKRILSHMNAWREHANVEFVLSATDPQVRITRALAGYWSYLGTDVLHIPKNEATMCLQSFSMQTSESEFRRVVRHETGHTLGFPHEHMRAAIINKLDVQKTIAYFRQTQGWSASMVQSQVLTPLAESSIMGTSDADETSIMAYNLPGVITKDGKPIIGGSDIAPQDIEFVGKIYPKAVIDPPPPEPPVGKGLEIRCDDESRTMYVWLKPGWKLVPKTPGATAMSAEYTLLAEQLEAAVTPSDSPAAAGIGGTIGTVLELVAALRSGDVNRIIKSLRDVLNALLGDEKDTIQFALGQRLNWAKLVEILTTLLPLVLSAK